MELDKENTSLAERNGRLDKAINELIKENKQLREELRKPGEITIKCATCGKSVKAKSKITKYCDKCRKEAMRASTRKYLAKRRSK